MRPLGKAVPLKDAPVIDLELISEAADLIPDTQDQEEAEAA